MPCLCTPYGYGILIFSNFPLGNWCRWRRTVCHVRDAQSPLTGWSGCDGGKIGLQIAVKMLGNHTIQSVTTVWSLLRASWRERERETKRVKLKFDFGIQKDTQTWVHKIQPSQFNSIESNVVENEKRCRTTLKLHYPEHDHILGSGNACVHDQPRALLLALHTAMRLACSRSPSSDAHFD